MSVTTLETEDLSFVSRDYENTAAGNQLEELIDQGKLPFDTLFRLTSIGRGIEDPEDTDVFPNALRWKLLTDMIDNAENPEVMRSDTRELLWGDVPDAVIDVSNYTNKKFYAQLNPMFYRLADMAIAVQQRRETEGQTVSEVPPSVQMGTEDYEWRLCVGLARPIWRLIVQRTHPEWIQNPGDYYSPTISFNEVYHAGDKTMRKRLIGDTVLSDTIVFETYQEATETGVVGIGPAGKESLRFLLMDEHPELH